MRGATRTLTTMAAGEYSLFLALSERPYTALLWIEFQASAKAQKVVDDLHPYDASAFIPGSAQEKLVRGKRTSVVQWDHFSKLGEYQAKMVEAYGFPQGGEKR